MIIEKLDIRHKALLFDRVKTLGTRMSEYSFANLYLFRGTHDHEMLMYDGGGIFIRGRAYDGFTFLMPTMDVREMDLDYLNRVMKDADFLYPVPEEWLPFFPAGSYNADYVEADSDYVYTTEKIATYKGSKLHKKRNLLKQFVSLHEHQGFPLTAGRLDDALSVLEAWQEESGQDRQATDYAPCREALVMNEDLVLCGLVYYADKEPAAFVLGEELSEDMFVLKFAKARTKFKGIYQYVYNDFAHLLPSKYKYFNFEVDLGKESLRHSKSSYVPDEKLIKYRVSAAVM